ncbi:hypothetical protein RFI_35601, partial [Reticulomyxa filosa]
WIVTLYVLSNYLICIGSTCERLLYAMPFFPGKGCQATLYVSYVRVLADGLFFLFYLVRATILLEHSVYQIPKKQQYFLSIVPMITYGGLFVAFNLRLQVHGCHFADLTSTILVILLCACHLFWNAALLYFLTYHIQQVLCNESIYVNKVILSLFFIFYFLFISIENEQLRKSELFLDKELQEILKKYLEKLLRLSIAGAIVTFAMYALAMAIPLTEAVWI